MAKSADVQIADELTVFEGLRPTRTGDLVVESQGIAPIPEDHRYGGVYRMFTVWFTPNMELSGVFTGTLAVVFGLGKTIVLPGAVQWLSSIAWDALVGLFGGQAAQLLFHVPFWVGVAIVLSLEGIASVWGYEIVHRLQEVGSGVLIVLFVVLSVRIFQHHVVLAQRGHFLGVIFLRLQPLHEARLFKDKHFLVHDARADRLLCVGGDHRARRRQRAQ